MSVCSNVNPHQDAYDQGFEDGYNHWLDREDSRAPLDYHKLCCEIAVQIGIDQQQGVHLLEEFGNGDSRAAYALLQRLKTRYAIFRTTQEIDSL